MKIICYHLLTQLGNSQIKIMFALLPEQKKTILNVNEINVDGDENAYSIELEDNDNVIH